MKRVTRERPKIDRIACPWLITGFIDPQARILFVSPGHALKTARAQGAVPYDIPGVALSHVGELCSFDAFLSKFQLSEPALRDLAVIIRGADTGRLDLAPQCAGLLTVSRRLSTLFNDDHTMLRHSLVVYDALYAWLCKARDESHS